MGKLAIDYVLRCVTYTKERTFNYEFQCNRDNYADMYR